MNNPIQQQMVVLTLFSDCPKLSESAYAITHYNDSVQIQGRFSSDIVVFFSELGFDNNVDRNGHINLSSDGKHVLWSGKLCKLDSNTELDIRLPFKIQVVLT